MRRIYSLFAVVVLTIAVRADDGVLPIGADGKPLNLDFETGTLKDWTLDGEAFKDQPLKGDVVAQRRADMKSQHQGQFWIGGYEKHLDKPQGTLTSVPFKVTHPWASFLVGGGPHTTTCVELVRKDTGVVFFRASGLEEENLRRVAVDMKAVKDVEIFIRVVDKHNGHWGHVNFDDFRFHAEQPKVSPRPKSTTPDVIKFAGLKPQAAAAAMTVPPEFKVDLFAGEPDIHQPIGFCLDDRGRLWVAEAYVYPKRKPFEGPLLPEAERKNGDRILIFEDADGDGKFDKRTTFIEGLNLVSGIEVGFGGVWVGAAPYFMFIPIEKDDKPGEIKVLLDGWHFEDTHETLNAFNWGPDGWLYGCHGVFTHSRVGKPGAPDETRTPINAGIWRYHPTKHIFEVFAQGSSNPWGLDYNSRGEWFIEACVIPHCFHIIQGARYLRQAGQHFNPYTYADIGTIADHLHYIGATPHGGNNRSDSAGGGHAHCGLMCYLGGTWPEKYRDQLFMGNIHGRRLNMDTLKPKGSGYVASHGPDFLFANDEWARFINFKYGPDGNVYMIDWYDKQACHRNEVEIWDRTNGRIFKVSLRGSKTVAGVDLQKCTDKELVDYQRHDNEWYVRHARRILQERAAVGTAADQNSLHKLVHDELLRSKNDLHRLRGAWAIHACGLSVSHEAIWDILFTDPSEHVRAWAVQLMGEHPNGRNAIGLAARLKKMAESDPSPLVRRYIASFVPKVHPVNHQVPILAGLLSHADDASDFNLPLLYWYAVESIAGAYPEEALQLAVQGKLPIVLQYTARRIATTSGKAHNALLVGVLQQAVQTKNNTLALTILKGMADGFKGRRDVIAPDTWSSTAESLASLNHAEIGSLTSSLSVTFGDAKSFARLRALLANPKVALGVRQDALASLLNGRDKELAPVLLQLLKETAMRSAAIRGLADYDHPQTPNALIALWPSLNTAEKRDALNTLAARTAYANLLLDAIAAKKILATDVGADVVRSLRNLADKEVLAKLTTVWGTVRDTPADRAKAMADLKKKLTLTKEKPDLMLGRAIYAKTCQTCHALYGIGGKVGPDITGSNRANLDYLLENVIDPSAVIPKDYTATVFRLNNGRTVTGIIRGDNVNAVTVQTANEVLVVNKGDIDEQKPTSVSMMPDDQLKPFTDRELRALFAYLQNPAQVPMLATPENAKDLFNGKDLTGWVGDPALWKVEDGEIVGKTDGLKKNEFLKSDMTAENFRLSLKVKLSPNKENSGIQFRSEVQSNGDVKGPQADVGAGWWGKLYEEHGRALLASEGGEKFVKQGEWNDYLIEAIDGTVRISINGNLCTNYGPDALLARRGIFALQLHSGGAMEVRYKELKLEVIDPPSNKK